VNVLDELSASGLVINDTDLCQDLFCLSLLDMRYHCSHAPYYGFCTCMHIPWLSNSTNYIDACLIAFTLYAFSDLIVNICT